MFSFLAVAEFPGPSNTGTATVMTIQTLSPMTRRRRVDWPLILGMGPPGNVPAPKVVERSVRGQLAGLLSAFDDILSVENSDAIIRRSVEVARAKIGFARAAIFLFD